MRWKERQEKVEWFTHNAIDDVANELGLKVPFYPEVYWIGRKLKFEDLGISEKYREDCNNSTNGVYLTRPKIILINNFSLGYFAEEGGHFLHGVSSGVYSVKRNTINFFSSQILVEMFGFFCSKLICPSRKNDFKKCNFSLSEKINEESICEWMKRIDLNSSKEYDLDPEIYYHGYTLGDKLYNSYISGCVSKKKIRDFVAAPLKKDDAFWTFLDWKYNILSFPK